MNGVLGQTRALAILLMRFWIRGAITLKQRRTVGRRASGFAVRMLMLVACIGWGLTAGTLCAQLSAQGRLIGEICLAVGSLGMSVMWAVGTVGPAARGPVEPLQAPLLHTLPLREASRVLAVLAQCLPIHLLGACALASAAPSGHTFRGFFLGLSITLSGALEGYGIVRTIQVLLTPIQVTRVLTVLAFGNAPFLILILEAPLIDKVTTADEVLAPVLPTARAIFEGQHAWLGFLWVFGLAVAAGFVIRTAERVGYDHLDALPTAKLRPTDARTLTTATVDRLLVAREPGGRGRWIFAVYSALMVGGFALVDIRHPQSLKHAGPDLLSKMISMITFFAFTAASTRASRSAERDVAARPLLAPLPITPADLLRAKASETRRMALLVALPLLVLPLLPGTLTWRSEALWRVATTIIAISLTAGALSSVSFLIAGLGASQRQRGFGTFSVESILLLLPLLSVATAPYVWSAVISLGCTALLAYEARRAALSCVRWLEDDDVDPETPVWRALLVFASFQAIQSFVGSGMRLMPISAGLSVAIAYVASAIALVALTLFERRGHSKIALIPARKWLLFVGVLGGILSGAIGLGYGKLLTHYGVDMGATVAKEGRFWLGIAVIGFAPIAEELFFRGQLQHVIGESYASRGRFFAPFVTAFAFAAIHPPLSFAPVLVLGLVTGALFGTSRAIGPGIIAHAIHNAMVVVLAT